MKVAVIISGRIKKWEQSIESNKKNFFDKMDCTFFSSCYGDDVEEFAYAYGITKDRLNVEEYKKPNPDDSIWISHDFPNRPYRLASMFYHMKKAFELVEKHPVKFDYVIRWRADNCIIFNDYIQNPTEDIIYIPRSPGNYEVLYDGHPLEQCPDQCAYGTMKAMKIYCSVYDNFFEYEPIRYGEEPLQKHLRRYNTHWRFTDCIIQYHGYADRFDHTTLNISQ
jgi:hypothetical protein